MPATPNATARDVRDATAEPRGDPIRPSAAAWVLAIAIISVIAALLRARYLRLPMRWDETYSFVNYSSRSLDQGLSEYTPNNHLLNTVLVHFAYRIFGDQAWAFRMPAYLAGVALVPATAWAIGALYSRAAGILAAAAVAGSSFLVEFSANARGYSLVALCAVLTVGFAGRLLEGVTLRRCLAFGAVGAVGLATIPIMVLPLGGVSLWLVLCSLARRGRERTALLWATGVGSALAAVLAVPIYLPAIVRTGLNPILRNTWVQPVPFARWRPLMADRLSETWFYWNRDLPPLAPALLLCGFLLATFGFRFVARGATRSAPVPLALAVLAWCGAFVLVRRIAPYSAVWLIVLPLYLGIGAAGLVWAGERVARTSTRRRLFPALAVLVALAFAATTIRSGGVEASPQTGRFAAAEPITLLLADRLRPGDRILAVSGAQALLEYYFRFHGVPAHYLHDRPTRTGIVYVAVDPENGRTIESFIPVLERSSFEFGPPALLRRYPDAMLYVVLPLGRE